MVIIGIIGVMMLCAYVSGSNSFPKPLTAEEERDMLNLYKNGSDEAKNILIEKNLRLVAHVVKKYGNHAKDVEDLISVGTIGLIKAITTYNDGKGTKLATYAARCIDNAILSCVTHIPPFLFMRTSTVNRAYNRMTVSTLVCFVCQ